MRETLTRLAVWATSKPGEAHIGLPEILMLVVIVFLVLIVASIVGGLFGGFIIEYLL